jgi:hypothetical protein
MKTKHLVAVALCYFTILAPLPSWAQAPDHVWVVVRVVDAEAGQAPIEYYGSIDPKEIDTFSTNTSTVAFLKLQHVAWMEDGQLVPISHPGADGRDYGYGDIAYLRVDTVVRIILLNDAFVKEHSLEPKAAPGPSSDQ